MANINLFRVNTFTKLKKILNKKVGRQDIFVIALIFCFVFIGISLTKKIINDHKSSISNIQKKTDFQNTQVTIDKKIDEEIDKLSEGDASIKDEELNCITHKETFFTIGEDEVYVGQKYIDINPGYDYDNPKWIHIDQDDYPLIFEFNNDSTRINVKEISGGDKLETNLIFISGQVPNHGDFADNYYVIIDPKIGKIVEDGYNYLFGNVHLNNSCTSCALPGLFFTEYSKDKHEFILANNKHTKEFVELLRWYHQFEENETCRINDVDYSIKEALKIANYSDRCIDQNLDTIDSNFITIGEYKQIIENIKSIISGENVMMFPRGYHGEGLSPLIRWLINDRGEVYTMPIDSKENDFDQDSIDFDLGVQSMIGKIGNLE